MGPSAADTEPVRKPDSEPAEGSACQDFPVSPPKVVP